MNTKIVEFLQAITPSNRPTENEIDNALMAQKDAMLEVLSHRLFVPPDGHEEIVNSSTSLSLLFSFLDGLELLLPIWCIHNYRYKAKEILTRVWDAVNRFESNLHHRALTDKSYCIQLKSRCDELRTWLNNGI